MTERLLKQYRIGTVGIDVFESCLTTHIPGRPPLTAAPNGDETMRDTIDHELGHVWTSWIIAGRPSLALQVAAARCRVQPHIGDLVRYEEEIVCSVVLGLRARRGDHRRPWDHLAVEGVGE